jgi:hypothetical protein
MPSSPPGFTALFVVLYLVAVGVFDATVALADETSVTVTETVTRVVEPVSPWAANEWVWWSLLVLVCAAVVVPAGVWVWRRRRPRRG